MARTRRAAQANSATTTTDHAKWEEYVRGPGKFQGEPAWVGYLYECWLDGGSDETEHFCDDLDESSDDDGYTESLPCSDCGCVEWYDVDDDMRAIFPELSGTTRVGFSEDSNGFVYGHSTTTKED